MTTRRAEKSAIHHRDDDRGSYLDCCQGVISLARCGARSGPENKGLTKDQCS